MKLKEGDICTCLVSGYKDVYKIISINGYKSIVQMISTNKLYDGYSGHYFEDPSIWRLSTEEEIANAIKQRFRK